MKVVVLAGVMLITIPLLGGDRRTIDPDDAYKNNCMRCHTSVPQYPPRMMQTILMHKRVRARITAEETKAIFEYLSDSGPSKQKASVRTPEPSSPPNASLALEGKK
jgi:hypothetical protein